MGYTTGLMKDTTDGWRLIKYGPVLRQVEIISSAIFSANISNRVSHEPQKPKETYKLSIEDVPEQGQEMR